jgi:hypothetical protein
MRKSFAFEFVVVATCHDTFSISFVVGKDDVVGVFPIRLFVGHSLSIIIIEN